MFVALKIAVWEREGIRRWGKKGRQADGGRAVDGAADRRLPHHRPFIIVGVINHISH